MTVARDPAAEPSTPAPSDPVPSGSTSPEPEPEPARTPSASAPAVPSPRPAPPDGAPYRPASPPRPFVVPRRLGYAVVAAIAVLALVVLAQGLQLSRLADRADRLARNVAEAEREQERRTDELRDRTDALTDRVRRSLDSAAIARHVLPSVFRVVSGRSSGSAFAVARTEGKGTYLVTNHHVVDDVRKGGTVRLTRGEASHTATLVATDAGGDVAVLRTAAEIPLLRLANAPPVPGEPVVVIGAPVGLEDTVTSGVVSKIRPIAGRKQEYIQFDAAINPGNSGGPVLNAGGRVVGIATAKAMDAEGIGFALPIGVACDSFDFIC